MLVFYFSFCTCVCVCVCVASVRFLIRVHVCMYTRVFVNRDYLDDDDYEIIKILTII